MAAKLPSNAMFLDVKNGMMKRLLIRSSYLKRFTIRLTFETDFSDFAFYLSTA